MLAIVNNQLKIQLERERIERINGSSDAFRESEMAETTREFVTTSAARLAQVDYAKMREIAKAIHDDRSLLDAFEKDPEGVAKAINGFEVPDGFHIHVADEDNRLYPAEEPGVFGDETRDAWERLEVRAGHKTISLVMCI
jgi:hypothetical protein